MFKKIQNTIWKKITHSETGMIKLTRKHTYSSSMTQNLVCKWKSSKSQTSKSIWVLDTLLEKN